MMKTVVPTTQRFTIKHGLIWRKKSQRYFFPGAKPGMHPGILVKFLGSVRHFPVRLPLLIKHRQTQGQNVRNISPPPPVFPLEKPLCPIPTYAVLKMAAGTGQWGLDTHFRENGNSRSGSTDSAPENAFPVPTAGRRFPWGQETISEGASWFWLAVCAPSPSENRIQSPGKGRNFHAIGCNDVSWRTVVYQCARGCVCIWRTAKPFG